MRVGDLPRLAFNRDRGRTNIEGCPANMHGNVAQLPGHFLVWLASNEAKFLKNRYVWVNWDVEELKSRAKEIESSSLLQVNLDGVDI